MSYTVRPFLVDLILLQAVYACHDAALLSALEEANAAVLHRDETPTPVWVARPGMPLTHEIRPAPSPTLRQALAEIIAGTVPSVEDGWQYWYAFELICAHLGVRLPNEPFVGIRNPGFAVLDTIAIVRDVTVSRRTLPFPLPPPVEFPMITYLRRDEIAATLARLPPIALVAPFENNWGSWDAGTRQAWQEEWPKRVQIQYRRWLEEARRTGRDVIAFFD